MHLRPIALTGKARAGKDTVAEYLVERYGYSRFAFADDIKRIAKDIFPWRFADGKKDRELLQQFGQNMRKIDPDVWVRRLFLKLDLLMAHGVIPVITDLRMPNEYAACREWGFVIIRIDADDEIRRKRMIECGDVFRNENINHKTERFVEGFDVDFRVENNGDIESLYEQVDEIMKKINKG
jgi:dephospho-CoA kinase